jgi:hypothetical protein
MTMLAHHTVVVGSRDDETWTEIADDDAADHRQQHSMLIMMGQAAAKRSVNNTTMVVLKDLQPKVDLVMDQVVVANFDNTTSGEINMTCQDEHRKKIAELHQLIEKLIG